MSSENVKLKNSKRRYSDEVAVKKQLKIAKQHGGNIEEPHKYHKRHAMDCGNPSCFICGNPRKTHKDKLTAQEKKLMQDVDSINDKHGNGSIPEDV